MNRPNPRIGWLLLLMFTVWGFTIGMTMVANHEMCSDGRGGIYLFDSTECTK